RGTALIIAPASGMDGRVFAALGNAKPEAEGAAVMPFREQIADSGFGLRVVAPTDPVLTLFRQGDYGLPMAGKVRRRLAVPKFRLPGAATLIAYEDGVPALQRYMVDGRWLWLWNIELDPRFGQQAYRPQFLPFLAELLHYSCRDPGSTVAVYRPGMCLTGTFGSGVRAEDIVLSGPDGKAVPLHSIRTGAGELELRSPPVAACGRYTWTQARQVIDFMVVNFPNTESDLRLLTGNLPGCKATFSGGREAGEAIRGMDMWPWLLTAAIIFWLLEGYVSWRFRREATT
ncbi:MAG: hypothetical protein PHQ27_10775, partial [Victivallales bacterium]|nr:hypothetical protein [Victivallales bacterium]